MIEALVMTPHTPFRGHSITLLENTERESIRASYRGQYEDVYFLMSNLSNEVDHCYLFFDVTLASPFIRENNEQFFGEFGTNENILELANELFEGSVPLQGRARKILSETLKRTASKKPLIKGML